MFTAPSYSPSTAVPAYPSAASAPGSSTQQGGRGSASQLPGAQRPGETMQGTGETGSRRIELAPPKPSEFQKFVELATGRKLPIFGSSFFVDAANSLSTVDNVPVSGDYTVGAGDELMVRIWGAVDADYRATVDRNGQINLPKVGSFTVAGVRASELEKHLRAQIGRLYTNFNLNVSLGQLRGVKVFVVGPARLPGVYTVASQGTMLSAVVAAGGPGPNGSMRKVQLRRNGALISELDIYDFLVQGDKSKDAQLVAGDVVVFQPAGPRVALTGALDTPAIYELKSAQEPVRDVLRYAGGTVVLTNPNKALIERIDPTRTPAPRYVEELKLDESGQQRPMRDGDVLTLLPISPQFGNAVTLKGPVAQPLRYAFTPGMRIRDLIPDAQALVSPEFYRRKNQLVQTQKDEFPKDDRRYDDRRGDALRGTDGQRYDDRRTELQRNQDRNSEVLMGEDPRATTTRSDELGRANGTGDRSTRADEVTSSERTKKQLSALFDELNWDYAVIERLRPDLTTEVISFNLGKAVLQADPANNVELQPGDVVTVFSQKDMRVPLARQTRLVTVEGEVGAAGVYQLQPGETLPQLLTRAGGFTPQAYVYGLEFTREETRQRQRENLAAAIARLEALAATQSAREAANRRDDISALQGASVSAAATQAQMARLRRVQPNGRIALELRPEDNTVESLPAVPLENGDRVIVPARPGFITVAGAVVNNNALLWKPGRTVGDYLNQAGLDEAAETSNMFVLRADGTAIHASSQRGFFGTGGIESQTIQPGDAIVVPTQLDFETWGRALVRNLKDFGQIFYQFGLGAAAIQTLRTAN
ncbi:MAG TPA: SLBB domain-containing protein [Burkholderiaceae bacterium]|nr:SLBB domain-containing protein [Burkholderiaceae bacterium]